VSGVNPLGQLPPHDPLASETPLLSVIIPTRNKKPFLAACLQSVLSAVRTYRNAEILVVDNGSTDGTNDLLRNLASPGVVTLSSDAATVSGVRNCGAAVARGQILCFLDSDCIVPENYLERIRDAFWTSQASAVGHFVSYEETTWMDRSWHRLHFIVRDGPVRWLPGACFNVVAEVFRSLGGFREDLESGEDVELAARLSRSGHLVCSSSSLVITHLDNPRSLAEFYRKEVWRGLGGTVGEGPVPDRVLLMSLAHLGLSVGAILVILFAPLGAPPRIGLGIAMTAAIPAIAVLYRISRVRRGGMNVSARRELLPGMVLYWLYLLARAEAAFRVWTYSRRRVRTT
jgi:glycosyltransferase involved in cell wall biosynthesis